MFPIDNRLSVLIILSCLKFLAAEYGNNTSITDTSSNANISSAIKFIQPFIDLHLKNASNVKLATTKVSGIFMLSNDELYQISISRNIKEIKFMRNLNGIKSANVTKFEVYIWDSRAFIIAVVGSHANVYHTKIDYDLEAIEPIEKIAIKNDGVVFLEFFEQAVEGVEHLFLVLGTKTGHESILRLFKWHGSYFTMLENHEFPEPLDELKILDGPKQAYLFAINYGSSHTQTVVKLFNVISDKLHLLRNVFVDADLILPYKHKNGLFLMACERKPKNLCKNYKIQDGGERMTELPQKTSHIDSEYINMFYTAGEDFFVANKPTEVHIFIDPLMHCYGVIPVNLTFGRYPEIIAYSDSERGNFILFVNHRENSVLIKTVEMIFQHDLSDREVKKDEVGASFHQLEANIAKLRSVLLQRKKQLDEIRDNLPYLIAPKLEFNVHGATTIKKLTEIKEGHIKQINVNKLDVTTPWHLATKTIVLQRRLANLLAVTNANVETFNQKKGIKRKNEDYSLPRKLKAQNMIFNGTIKEEFPENMKHSNQPVSTMLRFNEELHDNETENLNQSLKARNLQVKFINGIEWNRFYNETYLKNRDEKNFLSAITFDGPVKIEKLLVTGKLNDIQVEKLIPLSTDQEINSDIHVSKSFSNNLTAHSINGLSIDKDIALIGKDNIIESPVVIHSFIIAKDLNLADSDESNFARHIIGTKLEDLSQFYGGIVKINGTLTLHNIVLDKDTKLTADSQHVDLESILDRYWMKSIDQRFDKKVTFKNRIRTSQLQTISLNNQLVRDYVLCRDQGVYPSVSFLMDAAKVQGNIYLDLEFPSIINKISASAVRRGDRTSLQVLGTKTFSGQLITDHLNVKIINGIEIDSLVSENSKPIKIKSKKSVQSLSVKDELNILNELIVDFCNEIDVSKFLKSTAQVSENQEVIKLKTVNFNGTGISADHLNVQNFNEISLNRLLDDFAIYNNTLRFGKVINIDGDVEFDKEMSVEKLNAIEWNEFINLVVRNNRHTQIGGTKTFYNNVFIDDSLNLKSINHLSVDDWFANVLLKAKPQTIKSLWTFGNMKINNLQTSTIDGIPTKNLINTHSGFDLLRMNSNITIDKLIVKNNLFGYCNMDLGELNRHIKVVSPKHCSKLIVQNNAKIMNNYGKRFHLKEELKKALRSGVEGQRVTSKVTFTNRANVGLIETMDNTLQGIDLIRMATDSLLKYSKTKQIINAPKKFFKTLGVSKLLAENYMNSPVVNNVDILHFNSTLYRHYTHELIHGKKIFRSIPIIGNMNVNGLINGIDVNNCVFHNPAQPIPIPLYIKNLHVKSNLHINVVNNLELDVLLRSRVRMNGKAQEIFGFLTFDNLHLSKSIQLPSINDIHIKDIVIKNSDSLQEIHGEKIIEGNLTLVGPASIAFLNGEDLLGIYRNTLFKDRNYDIPNNIYVGIVNVASEAGIYVRETVNNHSIDEYFDWSRILYENIDQQLQIISEKLTLTERELAIDEASEKHSRLLYLEYDDGISLRFNRTKEHTSRDLMGIYNLNTDSDISDYSVCNFTRTQVLIQFTHSNHLYLKFFESNLLSRTINDFEVIAENFCPEGNSQISLIWKSSVDKFQYFRNVSFNSEIKNIEIFERPEHARKYAIVQLQHDKINSSIVLIRIDTLKNNIESEQAFQNVMETKIVMRLLSSKTHNDTAFTLILSSTVLDTQKSSVLLIYHFDPVAERFQPKHNIIGEFNIIDSISLDNKINHLILGCDACNKITIYSYDHVKESYQIYQILNVPGESVGSIVPFSVNNEKFFITTNRRTKGYYYLYKFCWTEGWRRIQIGFFKNLKQIIWLNSSLITKENEFGQHLIAVSDNDASVISLYTQG